MADNETSAVDVLYHAILADNPDAAGSTFIGFTPDKDGLVRELTEDTGDYQPTFGGIAIEQPIVEIGLRGNPQDYKTPRNEALKLRRLIANLGTVTRNDCTVLYFEPLGGIIYEGRDANRRVMFVLRFKAHMQMGS